MNIKGIFDTGFVSSVESLLNEKCVNGLSLTRSELCKHLDLASADEKQALVLEGVIGSLITLSVIEGFESRKGPGGGIGKIGQPRASAAKTGASGVKEVSYPDGFLTTLENTLSTLCAPGMKSARRKDISAAMGMPGSDTEALISAAIKDLSGLGAKYESQRGVGGGIKARTKAIEVQPTTDPAPVAESSASVAEAAPADVTETPEVAQASSDTVVTDAPEATDTTPAAAPAQKKSGNKNKKGNNKKS